MVFGDVSYREPRRAKRPDRDRARACLAYEVPRPGDLPIFLDLKPGDAIERHALQDTSVELGGILLGQECIDDETGEPFVWITQSLEAQHYENTQASFTYTHESWAEITRERDEKFPDLDIVGWYHTHPSFGVFLSGYDLFIQQHFFGQPLQVAYVVDPIRQTRGFFQWRDGRMEMVEGFFLTTDRAHRPALARFVHELEQYPNPEPSGGVLSPRLEAELIAMLNRPHTTALAAPAPTATTGLLAGLVGMLLGVLALGGGMWLNSLSMSVRDQADALRAIEKTVKKQGNEVDFARIDAKEKALDSLLSDIRVGKNRESFLATYERAERERDAARLKVEQLTTDSAALNELSTRLRTERKKVDLNLAEALSRADRLEEEADKSKKEYDKEINGLLDKVRDQDVLLKDTKAGTLVQKYRIAWYTAAGALIGCILLGLGLIWALGREPYPLDETKPLPDPPSPGGILPGSRSPEPPHAIS
jgi:proteasome lid subunit RPN8/RPN11